MNQRIRLTILGCGSSPGVPRPNGDWGNCNSGNPKNRRRRPAALFEQLGDNGGVTRVVVDTGPDFREQMIDAGVSTLDAVVYTHAHADHIHGIDDLRSFALTQRRLVDIYADHATLQRLQDGFGYCFQTPVGSSYPPILTAHIIEHDRNVEIAGEGGTLTLEPLPQVHGNITSLGFRAGPIAYCPDVSDFSPETARRLTGLDFLVVDALQYRRHPSHFSLEEALEWVDRFKPGKTFLTHMHVPLDYDTVMRETPDNVAPSHDGLVLEVNLKND